MSDDESKTPGTTNSADETAGEATDGSARGGTDEGKKAGPGGGPKRVVSKNSVDDILSSLNETKPASKPQGSARVTRSSSDVDPSEKDEALGDDRDLDPAESRTVEDSSEEDTTPDGSLEKRTNEGAKSPADEQPAGAETASGTDQETDADEETEPAIDADLTDRIERGAVTGADVRAAEAGDGREKTPEIDEIDISLDDIEATTSASTSTAESDAEAAGTTDGPLASSGEKPDDDTDTEKTQDDDSGGIVDRIRGLFGR